MGPSRFGRRPTNPGIRVTHGGPALQSELVPPYVAGWPRLIRFGIYRGGFATRGFCIVRSLRENLSCRWHTGRLQSEPTGATLLRGLLPYLPIRALQAMTIVPELPGVHAMFPLRRVLARQFREADPWLFRWSLEQLLTWPKSPEVDVPVYHVHGDRDPVLPHHRTTPERLVAGGGHVMTLTHPAEVNQFIDDCQRGVAAGKPEPVS